jgi:hypothetical protein
MPLCRVPRVTSPPRSTSISTSEYASAGLSTPRPGYSLKPGEKLVNGSHRLVYQPDGNLVLYRDSKALWATGTPGKPAGEAVMQTDGYLCLYSPDRTLYWRTPSALHRDSDLVLMSDGDLFVTGEGHEFNAWLFGNFSKEQHM